MREKELFDMLEQSGDAAFAIATGGKICCWNAAAESLFGYTAEQAVGRNCYELLHGRNAMGANVCRHDCEIWNCGLRGEKPPNFDLEVSLASGGRRWVNMSNIFYRDGRNGRSWMIHLARDISAEKSREAMVEKLLGMLHQLERTEPAESARLDRTAPLSQRQIEVLRLFSQGKDAATVARDLGITAQSLRNHLYHINRKLNTHDRLAAVTQAQRRSLL